MAAYFIRNHEGTSILCESERIWAQDSMAAAEVLALKYICSSYFG